MSAPISATVRKSIGDVCELVNGRAFKPTEWTNSGVPIIRIQNLNDESKTFNYFDGTYDPKHEVNNGDLLFSWSGTPGTSFGAFFWNRGRGVLNQHIFNVLVNPAIIEKRYLRYAMNNRLDEIIGHAHGGVGLQHITKGKLESIEIPLPPLSEQKRIADILDKADAIRRKRQEMNKVADSFHQSLYRQMFGDPIGNEMKWPVLPFGELATNADGRRKPVKSSDRDHIKGDYPYYGASGIIDYIDSYLFDEPALLIGEDGANLLSRSTPIAFLASGKYWVNNHAHVVLDNGRSSLRFLATHLNMRSLRDYVTGSAQPKLNQANLNKIPIPCPPLDQQQKFDERLVAFDAVRSKQLRADIEIQSTFDTLSHLAFAGDL